MSLTVNIKNGTRKGRVRLCDTCSHFLLAHGEAESCEMMHCQLFEKDLYVRVVECTGYHRLGEQSAWDMQQQAWILETRSSGKVVGFIKPGSWKGRKSSSNPLDGIDLEVFEKEKK